MSLKAEIIKELERLNKARESWIEHDYDDGDDEIYGHGIAEGMRKVTAAIETLLEKEKQNERQGT